MTANAIASHSFPRPPSSANGVDGKDKLEKFSDLWTTSKVGWVTCGDFQFLSFEGLSGTKFENVGKVGNLFITFYILLHVDHSIWFRNQMIVRGFIKGRAPGKMTGCERDLAINLPGCFLLFLLSVIRKTKNAQLKNLTDLLHKNLMKPPGLYVCNLKTVE